MESVDGIFKDLQDIFGLNNTFHHSVIKTESSRNCAIGVVRWALDPGRRGLARRS
jgi:hypothetical protein